MSRLETGFDTTAQTAIGDITAGMTALGEMFGQHISQPPAMQPEVLPANPATTPETGYVIYDGVIITNALAELLVRDPASPRAIIGLEAAKRDKLAAAREHWVRHGVWPEEESGKSEQPLAQSLEFAMPLERIRILNEARRRTQGDTETPNR